MEYDKRLFLSPHLPPPPPPLTPWSPLLGLFPALKYILSSSLYKLIAEWLRFFFVSNIVHRYFYHFQTETSRHMPSKRPNKILIISAMLTAHRLYWMAVTSEGVGDRKKGTMSIEIKGSILLNGITGFTDLIITNQWAPTDKFSISNVRLIGRLNEQCSFLRCKSINMAVQYQIIFLSFIIYYYMSSHDFLLQNCLTHEAKLFYGF